MQNHLLDSDVKVMVMVMVTLSQMFLANVSMTLIDTTDDKDPKKGEHYWIKTYAPVELNIEDGV